VIRVQSSAQRSLDKNIIISVLVYMKEAPKPVRWVGTSLRALRSSPRAVRIDIGHALFAAPEGKIDPAAKALKGFGGASVIEIVSW
jgi:phage-related protein